MGEKEYTVYKSKWKILFFCCLTAGLLNAFTAWQSNIDFHNQVLFFVLLIGLIFFYIKTFGLEKFGEKQLIFVIFALGFIFRLVYTMETGHIYRQHDVYGSNGHLEYIERLYRGEGLADTVKWQYYQPPVWHALCALWLKIQTFIGVDYRSALENLQLISLFCSSAIMFVSHRLFRMFELRGNALIFPCLIVAFHPTFIILSGSINNDVLSLLLALISVMLALKWYRDPKFTTIIALAFSIGFSMGVKLSGGLIALGIAILFTIRFFQKKANKLNLFAQFASFGAICVPIALWWQFRNLIKFDTPLTYVPMLSEKNSQYIGFRSTFERLFDFSSLWENGVYPARMIKSQPMYEYFEYNIPLGALKSSVFGEYYLGKDTILEFFAVILFWTAAILAVISIIASFYVIIKAIKTKNNPIEKIYPFIIAATLIFSYVKFCFEFAHFCTMDFRYIALTLVLGCLYIGLLLKETKENNKMFGKILSYVIGILSVVMSVSSLLIYVTIG